MTMPTLSALHDGRVDQPDPAGRPARRSFTAEYKHRIVAEYDELPHGSPNEASCCAARACTPPTSQSGAASATPPP
jgi:hypothetical protein